MANGEALDKQGIKDCIVENDKRYVKHDNFRLWHQFQKNYKYVEGEVFLTNEIPSGSFWIVTKRGMSTDYAPAYSLGVTGATVTIGTAQCKLAKLMTTENVVKEVKKEIDDIYCTKKQAQNYAIVF